MTPEQSELLKTLGRESFLYFVHKTNLTNGLVRDKSREEWPASIAAVGLALAAYPVGVAFGYEKLRMRIRGRPQSSRIFLIGHSAKAIS